MSRSRHHDTTSLTADVQAPAMGWLAGTAVIAAAVAALVAQVLISAADRGHERPGDRMPGADVMRATLPWGL